MSSQLGPAEEPDLVVCDAVSRTYGAGVRAVVAVHGATCAIGRGDAIAVTGPSGSGKSTLLHLLAGLDVPSHGTISWPALGSRDQLRPGPVAVVFQGPSLLPALDASENVALPALLAGASDDEATAAARAALERLDLVDLATKLPQDLSGGQAQRVAVARALVGNPSLIIADEPTGQLDHGSAAAVIDALLEAAVTAAAGLIVSTHDHAVASRLEGHWRMVDGRLHTDASPVDAVEAAGCSG